MEFPNKKPCPFLKARFPFINNFPELLTLKGGLSETNISRRAAI
jgi:hypothetical protein